MTTSRARLVSVPKFSVWVETSQGSWLTFDVKVRENSANVSTHFFPRGAQVLPCLHMHRIDAGHHTVADVKARKKLPFVCQICLLNFMGFR